MAHIVEQFDANLESPTLVEGLPGVGLVGKIATDHLINTFEMDYFAAVYCEGVSAVATYQADDHALRPPLRIYADEDRQLLALQSDIPVSPESATDFNRCLVDWLEDHGALPICLSGLPEGKGDIPDLYGIGTGDGGSLLDEHGIDPPSEGGLISGPTGAILAEANEQSLDSVGLIVQANPRFPDPEAARRLLEHGIGPIADIEVDTQELVEHAEEIAAARQQLAKRMEQAEEESSQAQPLGMYQ